MKILFLPVKLKKKIRMLGHLNEVCYLNFGSLGNNSVEYLLVVLAMHVADEIATHGLGYGFG